MRGHALSLVHDCRRPAIESCMCWMDYVGQLSVKTLGRRCGEVLMDKCLEQLSESVSNSFPSPNRGRYVMVVVVTPYGVGTES